MTFNANEVSADLGSPFELYLFRYGDEMPDEVNFAFTAIPGSPNFPQAKVTFTRFSNNGKMLIVGFDAAPYVRLYAWLGGQFVPMLLTPDIPSPATCAAFSGDDQHIVIGMENHFEEVDPPLDPEEEPPAPIPLPNLAFFRVTYVAGEPNSVESMVGTTLYPERPVLGDGRVHDVCYSTDGQHLLVGHDGFPYLTFYTRSGNSYSKFAGLVENAPGPCVKIDFANLSTCVIATRNAAPILYGRVGSNYTRLATLPMLLASGETVASARFNPAGDHIAVCRSMPPYISFFARNGATVTPTTDVIGGGPTGPTIDAYYDHLGEGLLVTQATYPHVNAYDIKDSFPVRTDEWDVQFAGMTGPIHGFGDLVVVGSDAEPYVTVVRRDVIIDDGAAGYYAYTNLERDYTTTIPQFGTVVFKAIPISRDAFSSNGKAEPTNMGLRLPLSADLANIFLPYPPPQPVSASIFQEHSGDDDKELVLVWSGKILSVSREGGEAVLNCDNNVVSMRRLGLRRNYQYGCPYVLYGPLCKASRDNASVSSIVVSVDGGSMLLTANWFQGRNPQDFAGGYISWKSKIGTEYRTISSVSPAGAITYVGPLKNVKPGVTVTITLGCNHQRSHCAGIHNNINNFGGQPWIPTKNPIKYHPFW